MTVARWADVVAMIAATTLVFINAALAIIIARPDGLGLWLMIGTAAVGCRAVRAIWRDRL